MPSAGGGGRRLVQQALWASLCHRRRRLRPAEEDQDQQPGRESQALHAALPEEGAFGSSGSKRLMDGMARALLLGDTSDVKLTP